MRRNVAFLGKIPVNPDTERLDTKAIEARTALFTRYHRSAEQGSRNW
jgi:hypothetical protein